MTIRPARLGGPRRVILGLRPRTGARRRSGAAPPDVTAPTIVSISPADLATGVDTATTVVVTFSESVNHNSGVTLAVDGGASVTCTVTSPANTVVLTPTAPLTSSTTYRVTVTTAVTDLAGNALAAGTSTTFGTTSSNPIITSGATSWFDAHDGSGLQVINSRIGAAAITLGAGSGVDTNDPVWGSTPYAWTFDATDDFISSTAGAPNITATTGKHTAMVCFSMPFNTNGAWWGNGTTTNRRAMIFPPAAGQVTAQVRGVSAAINAGTLTFASTASGTKTVVAIVIDTGVVYAYMYQGGTGTLSTSGNITGIGAITTTNPRYGNHAYTTTSPIGSAMHSMVEWVDLALDKTTLDSVAAYLIANA